MEIWDLYDENRALTGETMVRGDRVPGGRYHLIVDAHFLNSKGETLLQRRAKGKSVLPDILKILIKPQKSRIMYKPATDIAYARQTPA